MPEPSQYPRISIAVPSYNQAPFIRETLESLVDQQYPSLEVLIQDGGSTDGATEIAQEFVTRWPGTFSLRVQKDRGHAHALNLAFARSTGEILGYLNTDDSLYPGCLHRVAREIDAARGRYVVFGRSLFTGAGPAYVGREHPAEYRGHFDLLAVWKRGHNAIPQPSTFWHRTVHETCGRFDERHNHGLDYLQWCKVSSRFWFHKIDELWSTYRLHPGSVTANKTEQEWLNIMIRYSRMHWGPWWRPLRWRCQASHWLYTSGARHRLARALARVGMRPPRARGDTGFAGKYADNWIGPLYRSELTVPADASRLVVLLEHHPSGPHRHVSPALCWNSQVVSRQRLAEPGRLSFVVDLAPHRGRLCTLEVHTPEFFVPRLISGQADDRELSLVLLEQRIE